MEFSRAVDRLGLDAAVRVSVSYDLKPLVGGATAADLEVVLVAINVYSK